jgi:protein SCO1/2
MLYQSRVLIASAVLFALLAARPLQGQSRWGANYFPNVTLITQDGKQVKFYDDLLKGKIVAIYLFYTHCIDACPLETARMIQVQKILGDRAGKDIFFYGLSIDPKRDKPAALKAYAERYHITSPAWTFLTGQKNDIDLVAKKLGLYFDPTLNRDGHTVDVMFGNEPAGQWMKNSTVDNASFLARMISSVVGSSPIVKPQSSFAEAKPLVMTEQGHHLYVTQCAACHTIGHGDTLGPDLMDITRKRKRDWLARYIQVPDVMLQEGDPLATLLFKKYKEVIMPNLQVDEEGATLLINFIEHQSERERERKKAAPFSAPAADQPHQGDVSLRR